LRENGAPGAAPGDEPTVYIVLTVTASADTEQPVQPVRRATEVSAFSP